MERLATISLALLTAPLLLAVGCSAPLASMPKVARTEDPTPTHWERRDGLVAAEVVANDCVSRRWVGDFVAKRGRRPRIRVLALRNTSSARIDSRVYAQQIQAALLRTGKVALASALGDARAELDDQRRHASDASMKADLRARADFVMTGWIFNKPGAFMTVLELIDVETNEKVWITMHRSDR